jgi:hypothetical protein
MKIANQPEPWFMGHRDHCDIRIWFWGSREEKCLTFTESVEFLARAHQRRNRITVLWGISFEYDNLAYQGIGKFLFAVFRWHIYPEEQEAICEWAFGSIDSNISRFLKREFSEFSFSWILYLIPRVWSWNQIFLLDLLGIFIFFLFEEISIPQVNFCLFFLYFLYF